MRRRVLFLIVFLAIAITLSLLTTVCVAQQAGVQVRVTVVRTISVSDAGPDCSNVPVVRTVGQDWVTYVAP